MSDTDNPEEAMAVEAAGVPAVPEILDMKLDLSRDEKLRATALMMAVSYHKETIVKDGQMYQTMKAQGTNLRASDPKQVVEAAIIFEGYLRGNYNDLVTSILLGVDGALSEMADGETPTPDSEAGAQ